MRKIRIAIAGASGYAGAELVRLVAQHPHFELIAVTSEKSAGAPVGSVFPSLAGFVPLTFQVEGVGAEAVPVTDSSRVAFEADVLVTVIRT